MAESLIEQEELRLPLYFSPRSYQREFLRAMRAGAKRAALVWHRRAGKDVTTLNWTIEAMCQRPGTYYYFLPTYAQGKRIIWDGIQADGRPFREHFPKALLLGEPNNTEMKITMVCPAGGHSIFQIIGADNIDSIVGTNPVGCVFSEYSLMNPVSWDLVRPILAENGGWAVFVFTPRGRNWGWKLWDHATRAREFFTSLRSVRDTVRDEAGGSGEPVVSAEAIGFERSNGMSEELIQQEFYCSFEGSISGAYYGDLMNKLWQSARITAVPHDREVMVDTGWDLGVDDETVILFTQDHTDLRTGQKWLHIIDLMHGVRGGVEDYWKRMKELPYVYDRHFGPHDLAVKEWGTGNTRLQSAWKLGLNFEVQPKLSVAEGIQAVRRMLPYCWIDEGRCKRLIEALQSYHRKYDEKTMTYGQEPVHDWSSNFADAARYRALAYHGETTLSARQKKDRPTRQPDYTVFRDPYRRPQTEALDTWRRNRNPFS
jgi:hypothetical protein